MDLARSPKQHEREKAARELQKFPGGETEAVLRRLLDDDTERFLHREYDQISRVEYPVRSAAFYSLVALGKAVPGVALGPQPTPEEQRQLRVELWGKSFTTALKDDWRVSVDDGPSRVVEDSMGRRQETIVIVTSRRVERSAGFTLLPRRWPAQDPPGEEFLCIYRADSSGPRRFYLQGELPDELKQRVVHYFGLRK
jgi:hypothetical protein